MSTYPQLALVTIDFFSNPSEIARLSRGAVPWGRWEMPTRKRHSPEEIAAKLQQSDQMVADGMLLSEIAKVLGVSIMTFHRWRKNRKFASPELTEPDSYPDMPSPQDGNGELLTRISDLHSENSRLRRLVTDLLIETDRLEERLAFRPIIAENGTVVPATRKSGEVRRASKHRTEAALAIAKSR